MAEALVDLVGGAGSSFPHRAKAMHTWGHLMAALLTSASTPAD